MEILTDQIAVAIENAPLYGEVRQELAELNGGTTKSRKGSQG